MFDPVGFTRNPPKDPYKPRVVAKERYPSAAAGEVVRGVFEYNTVATGGWYR